MSYYFTKTVTTPFDQTVANVTAELKQEGFGILTQIDVQATLKEKLGVEFKKYLILGACSPAFAHKALLAENYIGVMLPCNVVIQEYSDGKVEATAVDPLKSMEAVNNPDLMEIAGEVGAKLQNIIARL